MGNEIRYIDLMPDIPLLDDGSIMDIYADRIGAIEMLGSNFRTIYVTLKQPSPGELCRIAAARIVRPLASRMHGNFDALLNGAAMGQVLRYSRSH